MVDSLDKLTIPISRDNRLCHFSFYNVIENEAHFVLECPLYNPIRDKLPSLFENVILGKFSFNWTIKLTLAFISEDIALYHSRELAGLKPP
jgi:hypothetical protein